MNPVSTNNLILLFKKNKLAKNIKLDKNKLKIISPQSQIGDIFYVVCFILFPIVHLSYSLIKSGINELLAGYATYLIMPIGTLVLYLYFSKGNNNITFDFTIDKIIIYRQSLLSKLFLFLPRKIAYSDIEKVEIKKSNDKSTESDYESIYHYTVYLLLKDKRRILLIQLTDTVTKTNEEIALAIKDFIISNITIKSHISNKQLSNSY